MTMRVKPIVPHGLNGYSRTPLDHHRREQVRGEQAIRGRQNRKVKRFFAGHRLSRFVQSESSQILRSNSTLIRRVHDGNRNGKKTERRRCEALQKEDRRKRRQLDQNEVALIVEPRYSGRKREFGGGLVSYFSKIARLNRGHPRRMVQLTRQDGCSVTGFGAPRWFRDDCSMT